VNAAAHIAEFPDPPEQSRSAQNSDTEVVELLKAERELQTIEIILKHTCVSDIAFDRIIEALQIIRFALKLRRTALRLRPRDRRVPA
jgi:hypothetical protein